MTFVIQSIPKYFSRLLKSYHYLNQGGFFTFNFIVKLVINLKTLAVEISENVATENTILSFSLIVFKAIQYRKTYFTDGHHFNLTRQRQESTRHSCWWGEHCFKQSSKKFGMHSRKHYFNGYI